MWPCVTWVCFWCELEHRNVLVLGVDELMIIEWCGKCISFIQSYGLNPGFELTSLRFLWCEATPSQRLVCSVLKRASQLEVAVWRTNRRWVQGQGESAFPIQTQTGINETQRTDAACLLSSYRKWTLGSYSYSSLSRGRLNPKPSPPCSYKVNPSIHLLACVRKSAQNDNVADVFVDWRLSFPCFSFPGRCDFPRDFPVYFGSIAKQHISRTGWVRLIKCLLEYLIWYLCGRPTDRTCSALSVFRGSVAIPNILNIQLTDLQRGFLSPVFGCKSNLH